MASGTFVTAVNCMDGRTQLPVIEYLSERYAADYVDMVTEPGPIKFLAENDDAAIVESIRNRVAISVNAHGSGIVAIVGHDDCAGNPVPRETQESQIKKAIVLVRPWFPGTEFIGLFVKDNTIVEEVK
ncbi:MAG: hypothetical protein JSV44_08005 [Candidatus Zixiibacteriota bacterium]|nr:MAG: hypothetical protein JSV44_08005 [candidate division Zixibacteria bacterium]